MRSLLQPSQTYKINDGHRAVMSVNESIYRVYIYITFVKRTIIILIYSSTNIILITLSSIYFCIYVIKLNSVFVDLII